MISKLIYLFPFLFFICSISEKGKYIGSSEVVAQDIALQNGRADVIGLGTGIKYKFKGMAITEDGRYGYFGSWNQKEIVKIDLKSKEIKVLDSPYNGKLNGMGTYIRNGRLYALMNEIDDHADARAISVLLVYNLQTDELINTYEAKGDSDGRHHFNHVVVDAMGTAYISNTLKQSICIVNTQIPNNKIDYFISDEELIMIHGLDLSDDESTLFCTSYKGGIKIIDISKKKLLAYSNPDDNRNDGLIFYNNFLFGVGGNTITRYELNSDKSRIVDTQIVLRDHAIFNDPRCLQMIKDDLYCLANIEIKPVRLRRTNNKARTEALTDSHLIKLRVDPLRGR